MPEKNRIIWNTLDRAADLDVSYRKLPHWDQTGALTFVTFRLADSMPRNVVERWMTEQLEWLRRNNIRNLDIASAITAGVLPGSIRNQLMKYRKDRWHDHLDACHGRCLLREPTRARIVADSLRKFDGNRYDLERFVIMPNHVHLLVQMHVGFKLRKQCEGWLRYTARQINQAIGEFGEFWQSEPFDHIVRNSEQFEFLRNYIQNNPNKAQLKKGEFLFWKRT